MRANDARISLRSIRATTVTRAHPFPATATMESRRSLSRIPALAGTGLIRGGNDDGARGEGGNDEVGTAGAGMTTERRARAGHVGPLSREGRGNTGARATPWRTYPPSPERP